MKYKGGYSFIYTILFFIVLLLQGCTRVLVMEPIPNLEGGSPLSEIEPVTFIINGLEGDWTKKCVKVDPNSGVPETVVAFRIDKVVIHNKPEDLVVQAIRNELIRNGHKVLDSKYQDKANIIIDVVVEQYWTDMRDLMFRGALYEANVKAQITVREPLISDYILRKSYKGNSSHNPFIAKPLYGEVKAVLNEALLEMVKDFTFDPDFLNILRKSKKSQ